MQIVDTNTAQLLREYAGRYETADFIVGDPSWFMHQVSGRRNQEIMAFMAAALKAEKFGFFAQGGSQPFNEE